MAKVDEKRPKKDDYLQKYLSCDEFVIATLSDDEIRFNTYQYSFDAKQAAARLRGGGNWQRIIQSHLFFDHIINQLLIEELTNPGQINLDRMTLSAKVDLVSSLGLIDDSTKGFLRTINGIRNKIAHNLSYKVQRLDINRIVEFSPNDAKTLMRITEWKANSSILFKCLFSNIMLLERNRQDWQAHRLAEKRRKLGLKAASKNAAVLIAEIKLALGPETL